MAPIRPLMVMTRPMMKLPSTHAPMAILQSRPTAIMDEAVFQCQKDYILYNSMDINRSLTNFPVGHCPGIGHPVGNISTPVPCSLRRRDRVEIGVGQIRRLRKTTRLLTDLQTEARQYPPLGHVTGRHRFRRRGSRRTVLLPVRDALLYGCHGKAVYPKPTNTGGPRR